MLSRQILFFLCIGTCGFLVEAIILQVLLWQGVGPIVARMIGFPVAVLTTWLLHRRFTFAAGKSDRKAQELTRYFSAQIFSALLGLGVYAWLVLSLPFFIKWPLAALVVSSVVGMVSNFLLSRFAVFTETQHD
ncbi:MAG: GtrA family protein [Woeseiaceae bacterium]